MSKYKLVIFDWDGTLVNSTARIIDSMQQAAQQHSLPEVSDAEVQNIIGLGLPEAMQTLWPDLGHEQLKQAAPSYAKNFIQDSKVGMEVFPGTRELLSELMLRNYLLAVATGKARKGLDRTMHDLSLRHFFADTRCADETRSKPDPLMLHELLASLGVAAHEALMVGDTTYDLDMANAAGMDSLGMSYGAHEIKRLEACNPLTICHSMQELQEWIINHG